MAISNIHVVAAVFENKNGQVLVAQRPADKTMAGAWEFPGGKLETGESRLAGLARELHEELGIHVVSARPLIRYTHNYPGFEVDLDVWRVEQWQGAIGPCEGQVLRWSQPAELLTIGLLPADEPVIDALKLPDRILITPAQASAGEAAFLDGLERAALPGSLICLRRPDLDASALLGLAAGAVCRLENTGVKLVLNGDPSKLSMRITELPATFESRLRDVVAGIHMPSRFLAGPSVPLPPAPIFLGASCHDAAELEAAIRLGATYAFLGNVKETPSHPGQPGLGWDKFSELIKDLPLPVYAIGGVGPDDLETAWAAGAQGVAGISAFWPK